MNKFLHISIILLSTYIPTCAQDIQSFTQGGFEYYFGIEPYVDIADQGVDVPLPVSADGTLTIPSEVTHDGKLYKVQNVRQEAFINRDEIRHLVISEGVVCIGRSSFGRCLNLESIHIPSTLLCYEYAEDNVFYGCKKLQHIVVDEANEKFDSRNDCNAIIQTDDNILIFGCRGTQIPATVSTIGFEAFKHCQELKKIDIPEGVERIAPKAFVECVNLQSVTLPSTLQSIGASVFRDCMNLDTLQIPTGVSRIDGGLFDGCYNMKKVVVDKGNPFFDSRDNCNAVIDSTQDTIVAGCGNTTIPYGIKGIGQCAFMGTSIKSIYIPKSITKIGLCAFRDTRFCNSISVDPENAVYYTPDSSNTIVEKKTGRLIQGCSTSTIPATAKEIGDYAFYGLKMPPFLIISAGVETIGHHAFTRSCGLQFVQMPPTLKCIKESAFSGCDGIYYLDLSKCNKIKIGDFAFSSCSSLYIIDLPQVTAGISRLAFASCPGSEYVERVITDKH